MLLSSPGSKGRDDLELRGVHPTTSNMVVLENIKNNIIRDVAIKLLCAHVRTQGHIYIPMCMLLLF